MKNNSSWVLNHKEELIIKELFNEFASNNNNMKHIEFLEFAFVKNLHDSRHTLIDFSKIYRKIQNKENELDNKSFFLLINECSILLYPGVEKPINYLLKRINGGKSNQNDLGFRNYFWDESLKLFLDYEYIDLLEKYFNDLIKIFTLYSHKNFIKREIFFTWKELRIQNIKIPLVNIMKFLRDAEIIPIMVNLEFLNELFNKIITPMNDDEINFFYEKKIRDYYDLNSINQDSKIDGDPGASFSDFIIIILKIGYEIFKNTKSDDSLFILIESFFKNNLFLRENNNSNNNDSLKPNIPEDLKKRIIIYHENIEISSYKPPKNNINYDSLNPYKKILNQENNLESFIDLLKQAELSLNQYNEDNIKNNTKITEKTIGDHVPVVKDKKMNQNKKNAKNMKNKEPPIPYESGPRPTYEPNYQRIIEYHKKLLIDEGHITMEKASFSHIEVSMELLKEVIYPLNINNDEVYVYWESVFENQINGNYELSLRDLYFAKQCIEKSYKDMEIEHELFFEYIEGSIYESAGRDDLAIQSYLSCKKISNKLILSHPDRSLYLIGLGNIFYHSQEYELSLRAFNDAKVIRELNIGPDTIETANVYNNLACVFVQLNKFKEAYDYLRVAEAIMDYELGTFNERTLTIKRNKEKCLKGKFNFHLEKTNTWVVYHENKYLAQGKNPKKKK